MIHGTPLQIAANLGNTELVKALLDMGAGVNSRPAWNRGRTVLQAAVSSRKLELVRFVVGAGARINDPGAKKGGRTAIQAALELDDEAIVMYLLEGGGHHCPGGRDTNKKHEIYHHGAQ
jgi:ankyrin repeat protein